MTGKRFNIYLSEKDYELMLEAERRSRQAGNAKYGMRAVWLMDGVRSFLKRIRGSRK